MIWIPSPNDDQAYLYTEEGVVHGVVRYMERNKMYVASTNKTYLGQYKKLLNAQKAVEEKYKREAKPEGSIIH